ncbi:hypothetical protein LV92_01995 [Arenibacter echinorum]|uniref:Uncharacterized protein n=1 Tax=Arenibacter echinorum TaxID=440515 RepID=A0A327R7E1_9FLAO|nr:hypothetical protein LV92_01995 [Arenibacter echinorum]
MPARTPAMTFGQVSVSVRAGLPDLVIQAGLLCDPKPVLSGVEGIGGRAICVEVSCNFKN